MSLLGVLKEPSNPLENLWWWFLVSSFLVIDMGREGMLFLWNSWITSFQEGLDSINDDPRYISKLVIGASLSSSLRIYLHHMPLPLYTHSSPNTAMLSVSTDMPKSSFHHDEVGFSRRYTWLWKTELSLDFTNLLMSLSTCRGISAESLAMASSFIVFLDYFGNLSDEHISNCCRMVQTEVNTMSLQ